MKITDPLKDPVCVFREGDSQDNCTDCARVKQTTQTPPNYWPFPTTLPNLSEKAIKQAELAQDKEKLCPFPLSIFRGLFMSKNAYKDFTKRFSLLIKKHPALITMILSNISNTKNAIPFFNSITDGWIDYSHNLVLVKLFSHALVSSSKGHEAALAEIKSNIAILKQANGINA